MRGVPMDVFYDITTFLNCPMAARRLGFADFHDQVDKTVEQMGENPCKAVAAEYDAKQTFLCQQCGNRYAYGEAMAALDVDPPKGVYRYNPLCFCSEACGGKYLNRTGSANPPVGAEIPLGDWQMCNLGRGQVVASEAVVMDPLTGKAVGQIYTETHDTVADPMGLNKIADALGIEAGRTTEVIEQVVKIDETK
jgi:hypothetical protein